MIGYCQDCGLLHTMADVIPPENMTEHILKYVHPGEIMPMGGCRQCGSLVILIDEWECLDSYISNGGVYCPVCGSSDIEGGSFDAFDSCVVQNVWCLNCGARWEDHYELASASLDKMPSEFEKPTFMER